MHIDQGLIDCVNKGTAWGFVGTGASCAAGLDSWSSLATRTARELAGGKRQEMADKIDAAIREQKFSVAFSHLVSAYGRQAVNEVVCRALLKVRTPGPIHCEIAKWPFEGYVTTNYDSLLELAVGEVSRMPWISIGNTANENRKIHGGTSRAIWHPHGLTADEAKCDKLVLTEEDYDSIYPAGSTTRSALEALLRMKRFVFIGFGFKDPDLLQMLNSLSRLTTPDRPLYAFLADASGSTRSHYRDKYNVHVIAYSNKSGTHAELEQRLQIYQSFIVTRDLRLGRSLPPSPEYDSEVTALMTHNKLCANAPAMQGDAQACLMRSQVLNQLRHSDQLTLDAVHSALCDTRQYSRDAVDQALGYLAELEVLVLSEEKIHLTKKGERIILDGGAEAERIRDVFRVSINNRVQEIHEDPTAESTSRIVNAVFGFCDDMARKRGLAIAQQLTSTNETSSGYRMKAILSSTTRDFLAAVLKELVTARIRPFESREGLDTLFDHEGCKCFFTLMLRDPCRRNSVVLLGT